MNIKTFAQITLLFLILILLFGTFSKYLVKNTEEETVKTVEKIDIEISEDTSNLIEGIEYISEDERGNLYTIKSVFGKIDINNPDIIYMTDVTAYIDLIDRSDVEITSKYAKYNNKNYDTTFNENVLVKYLNNRLKGEILDFYFNNNIAVMSQNIFYENDETKLFADKVEIDLITKDTKIFMENDESIIDEFLNYNKKKVKVINQFK